mmetsp:Transcript_8442/g.24194  ORF Transcript_8442/g.24194 Transcript_8442/m.24194 type:complete len:215 (+) Transcript_8442:1169-1813(+)
MFSLGQAQVRLGLEVVQAANQLVHAAKAQRSQASTDLLSHKVEVVDHISGCTWEAGTELLALGGNADRAVVGVAYARHDAAGGDHCHSSEAVLVGSHGSRLEHIKASADAAINAQDNTLAQLVCQQSVMGFDQAHLHGATSVLDGGDGGSSSATVVPTDLDDIGIGLSHATGNRANASLSNELHADLSSLVNLVKVVDELSQILNGVDVMMRGR